MQTRCILLPGLVTRVTRCDWDIDVGYRYGLPRYRYGIWDIDMGDDSIDMVILDIDMGYLVTLLVTSWGTAMAVVYIGGL